MAASGTLVSTPCRSSATTLKFCSAAAAAASLSRPYFSSPSRSSTAWKVRFIGSLVFHSLNLIHRDVKPENFMISNDDASLVYLIDFGLSKYYRTTEGRHIEFVQKSGVIGTARYASINAL